MLEQRVMLSADPVVAGVPAPAPDGFDTSTETLEDRPVVEASVAAGDDLYQQAEDTSADAYDPAESLESLFAAFDEAAVVSETLDISETDPAASGAESDAVFSAFSQEASDDPPALIFNPADFTIGTYGPDGAFAQYGEDLPFSVECREQEDGGIHLLITVEDTAADELTLEGDRFSVDGVSALLPDLDRLTIAGDVVRIAGAFTLDGDIEIEARDLIVGASLQAKNIRLTAEGIELEAAVETADEGSLVIQPADPAATIGLGDGTIGDFHLTEGELAWIASGSRDIFFGRSDGSHHFDIGSFDYPGAVTFRAPMDGGAFNVRGEIHSDEVLTFIGSGHTQTQHTDTVTSGDEIFINDSVIVADDAKGQMGDGAILYDTTDGGASPAGADIFITGSVNGQVPATSSFNGMTVVITADITGTPYAEYSNTLNKLTVHVKNDGSSTTDQVAAAIGNVYSFYSAASTGTAAVASGASFSNVTSGGSTQTLSSGSFPLAGDTLTFSAGSPAAPDAYNSAGVQLIADSSTAAGYAEFSVANHLLVVHIQSGQTTTAQIAAAIEGVFNFFDTAGGSGNPVILEKTFSFVTSGGDAATPASGSFTLSGDNIALTANTNGDLYDGVTVNIVADGTGAATASYDSVNKILTVHVKNDGTSSTTDVRVAIDTQGTFDAAGGTGNTVALTASYSAAITGGDARNAATGAFTAAGDEITFSAGRTIDGTGFNGLAVRVVADAAGDVWQEFDRTTRTLVVHALADGTSTTSDVAEALGRLFNVYDVGGGSTTLVADTTDVTFFNRTSDGDVNAAASGSFDIAGDTIAFSAGRLGEALYLDAGSGGDINIQGDVGVDAVLEHVVILNARNVVLNGQVVLSGDLVQNDGTGTSRFDLDVVAGRHVDLDVTGAITFNSNLTAENGDITLQVDRTSATTTGKITVKNKVTVAKGDLSILDAKTVTFENAVGVFDHLYAVNVTGTATFGGALAAGTMDLTVAGGILFESTVALNAGNGTLTSDSIDFNGGAQTVTGALDGSGAPASTLVLRPTSETKSIDVGSPVGSSGTLLITDTDLEALNDGFLLIQFGYQTNPQHAMVFGSSTFLDPLAVYTGSLLVNGALSGTTSATVVASGVVNGVPLTAGSPAVTIDTALFQINNEEVDDVWGNSTVVITAALGDMRLKNDGALWASLSEESDPAVQNSTIELLASTGNITRQTGSQGQVGAETLTVTAQGNIDLKTAVDTLDASSTGIGDIVIAELDGIDLFDVDAADGSVTVTAGGTIVATDVALATAGRAVSLQATAGDLELHLVDAPRHR